MQTFFEPNSYQLTNGKWISSYKKITHNGSETEIQKNSLDKQFDSQEEANKYSISYCSEQGYIPDVKFPKV
ncbi:MAG: hypothetical protein Q8L09_04340 [Candidatus Moranbacteria bacterium]|nr:hypothetical protein [Candidatus Moranbacteria bacterium]